MKNLLGFGIIFLLFWALFDNCSIKEKPKINNQNDIFIKKYLPEIRDFFCEKTLTLKTLNKIVKGKSIYGHAPNGVNWAELFIDTTDSSISIFVFLDSSNAIHVIRFNFPFDLWHKEQMIPIFGQYSVSKLPKKKDGIWIDFQYGKNCVPPKRITGLLNDTGSIRAVSMQDAISEDSINSGSILRAKKQ